MKGSTNPRGISKERGTMWSGEWLTEKRTVFMTMFETTGLDSILHLTLMGIVPPQTMQIIVE